MPAPYRADHVGSLLRPAAVKAARESHFEAGSSSPRELAAVEDAAIIEVVKMQEAAGLKAVTDGEYRRSFWHYDFIGALDGFELVERDQGVQFHGATLRPIFPTITGRLDFPDDHPLYVLDVYTVEGELLYHGIETPGTLMSVSDAFYFGRENFDAEYGAFDMSSYILKKNR